MIVKPRFPVGEFGPKVERKHVDPWVAGGKAGGLTGSGGFGTDGADFAAEGVVVEVRGDLAGDGGGRRPTAAGFDLVIVPDVPHVVHHRDMDFGVAAHRLIRVHDDRLGDARVHRRQSAGSTGRLPGTARVQPTPDVRPPDARPFPGEVRAVASNEVRDHDDVPALVKAPLHLGRAILECLYDSKAWTSVG